jgi:hypothetical protein
VARPAVAVGQTRVRILQSDATDYDPPRYLYADCSGNHSKAVDGSGLTLTSDLLEYDLAADPDMLDDAFAVVELNTGTLASPTWTAIATPFLLAPGSGNVIKADERSDTTPVATGALHGLAQECIVLPTECDDDSPTLRHAGGLEQNRYLHSASKGYAESLHAGYWNDADVYTPDPGTSAGTATIEESDDSFTLTAHGLEDGDRIRLEVVSGADGLADDVYTVSVQDADTFTVSPLGGGAVNITTDGTATIYTGVGAKYGEPYNWDANADAAEYVFRDADEGNLTLGVLGDTVTLAERTVLKVIATCDEEGKVYVDGPNQGGVILQLGGDETGYTEKNARRIRLEPGTYKFGFEMTTVGSVGGDGNDSFRMAVGTIDDKGNMADVLAQTDATTRVHRQNKGDERPGMSPMETVRRLFAVNSDLGVTGADILLDSKTFTDALDSDDEAPAAEDCREWVWPLGTPLASVLADMSEDADFDLSPDFEFGCWLDRGTDLSASVALVKGAGTPTAGMNVLEYSYDSEPIGPTRYLTLSQDGFDIVVGTSAESTTRPRFGFFESGASGSIGRARRNARAAIRQNGRIRRFYRAKIIAVTGCVPYVDFDLCDVISGRDHAGAAVDLEVTDIAWEQADGTTLFTLELGEL